MENASVDLYTTDAWTAYAKNAIITEAQDGLESLALDSLDLPEPEVAAPTTGPEEPSAPLAAEPTRLADLTIRSRDFH